MSTRTAAGLVVEPGDFAVVRTNDSVSWFIRRGEEAALMASQKHRLSKEQLGSWEHAVFYVGGPDSLILEAEPGGARLVPMHYVPEDVLWSTGKLSLALSPAQRTGAMAVAQKYKGTPYSFLDYSAIGLHSLGLNDTALKNYVASTGHMICSQLVDQCRLELGSHLFSDSRWPGYVDPLDLAMLITNAR